MRIDPIYIMDHPEQLHTLVNLVRNEENRALLLEALAIAAGKQALKLADLCERLAGMIQDANELKYPVRETVQEERN